MKIFHSFRFDWYDVTIMTGIYFLFIAGLDYLLIFFFTEEILANLELTWTLYQTYQIVISLIILCFVYWLSLRVNTATQLNNEGFSISYFLMAIVLGTFTVYFQEPLHYVYEYLPGTKDFHGFNREIYEFKLESLPYAVLSIVICPISEEIFFRKIIFRKLTENYGFLFALIFSSLLFGAFHLPDIYQFYTTIWGGMIACILLYTTNKIQYPIIFHIVWNAIVFFSDYVSFLNL